jgi:DNA-binding transcriptional MerR regulator
MDITNDEDKYTLHKSLGFSLEEIKALLDWFKTVKENNGQVIGWW